MADDTANTTITTSSSDDFFPTLRLAAVLWLVAYGLHIVAELSFLPVAINLGGPAVWFRLSSTFAAPGILTAVAPVPAWFSAPVLQQVSIAASAIAALAWSLSCCLIASAVRPAARGLAWAVICLAIAAVLLGLAYYPLLYAQSRGVRQLVRALDLLDPLVGVLLALLLMRAVVPRVNDRLLADMMTPLFALAVGRTLVGLEVIAPQIGWPLQAAIVICTIANGVMFAAVTARLWHAAGRRLPLSHAVA